MQTLAPRTALIGRHGMASHRSGTIMDPRCTDCCAIRNSTPSAARSNVASTLFKAGVAPSILTKTVVARQTIPVVEIAEILPAGSWPRKATGASVGKPSVAKNRTEAKIEFIESLGPVAKYVTVGMFGGETLYEAYEFVGPAGNRIIIADTYYTGDALYVFDGDHPDWQMAAAKTRYTLYSTRPAGYLGRVYHTGDWQERLREFVATFAKRVY